MKDTFQLLHSPSENEYKKQQNEVLQRWDALFVDYFMKNIHEDVPTALVRCILESLQVYHPYSGVTNNQSEGFNRVGLCCTCPVSPPSPLHEKGQTWPYRNWRVPHRSIYEGITARALLVPVPTATPNEIVDSICNRKLLW